MGQLGDYIRKCLSTQWAIGRAKCAECGNEWNVIYPKVKGGEYKLQCTKCGKRNSSIISDKIKKTRGK